MINTRILALFITFFFLLSGCGQEQVHNLDSQNNTEPPISITEKVPDEIKPEPVVEVPKEEQKELPTNPDSSTAGQVDQKSLSWYLKPNLEHTIPEVPASAQAMLNEYQGFYVLPNDNNKIYLTFDEGYELGYTPLILDILKANNVKATFFITGHYLKSQPELVKRMVNEGHMVANHTWNHPNLSKITPDELNNEIIKLENEFNTLTGSTMPRYIRPPAGSYSQASLNLTNELGYKTVFWSLAFNDWDPNKQPGADFSYQYVLDHIHPGAVILLHAVSQSNTEALNDIILDLQKEGYSFSLFN